MDDTDLKIFSSPREQVMGILPSPSALVGGGQGCGGGGQEDAVWG